MAPQMWNLMFFKYRSERERECGGEGGGEGGGGEKCVCVCVCVCVWGGVTLPLTKCPFCNLNSAADLIIIHNNT